MARIEGIRIRRYRALGDVTLGKLWDMQDVDRLTPITAVIGPNGAGKSSLVDAFGFLADCLKLGVEEACDAQGRGGFSRIRSQGRTAPIEFTLHYREHARGRPITYEVAIDVDGAGRPFVRRERLWQRRVQQRRGRPLPFLMLDRGRGLVWKGAALGDVADGAQAGTETLEAERIELSDTRVLGVAILGALVRHPRIAALRAFLQSWHLSYFAPDAAGGRRSASRRDRLCEYGQQQLPPCDQRRRCDDVLQQFTAPVHDAGSISTATLQPPPFLCLKQPENGLYHRLLKVLVNELRQYTTGQEARQVFLTTHQPYLVDGLAPEETWVLTKGHEGFSTARRASDDPVVRELFAEGLGLGGLWHSGYLGSHGDMRPHRAWGPIAV